jgi:hypothetical protein
MRTVVNGFLDGRKDDWFNRIAGPERGRLLSQSRGKRFIHIGVHRTGATYLQKVVFPAYNESKDLFSDDVIAGKFFDNGLDNVARVREMVGDVTIILILRNQASLLNSAYRTYVKGGGIWTYYRYTEEIIRRGKYDHAALVQRYFDIFGEQNCRILLYEDMMRSQKEFLVDLLSIIGVEDVIDHSAEVANPGPTKYFNETVRWMNILLMPVCGQAWAERLRASALRLGIGVDNKIVKRLFKGASAKRQFGYQRATALIQNSYADSNAKLAEKLGRDVSELGYV